VAAQPGRVTPAVRLPTECQHALAYNPAEMQ
jgi:hypothetical protein